MIKVLFIALMIILGNSILRCESLDYECIDKDSLSSEDIIKFSEAFEYIKNYQDLDKTFKMYYWDSTYIFKISISSEVLDSSPIFFSEEIVEYEYEMLDPKEKARIKDSIWHSEDGKIDILKCDSSFFEYNRPGDSTDLLVFFNIPEKNKLLVFVFPYMGFADYKNAAFFGQYSLNFLFYFEGDEIIKVFTIELT